MTVPKRVWGPYPARVDEVHDGDSIYFTLDLGFGFAVSSHDVYGRSSLEARLTDATGKGINAPELTVAGQPNPPGHDALAFLADLLPVGLIVTVRSWSWDKYGGRYDAAVTLPDGRDVGQVMLDSGHAAYLK